MRSSPNSVPRNSVGASTRQEIYMDEDMCDGANSLLLDDGTEKNALDNSIF